MRREGTSAWVVPAAWRSAVNFASSARTVSANNPQHSARATLTTLQASSEGGAVSEAWLYGCWLSSHLILGVGEVAMSRCGGALWGHIYSCKCWLVSGVHGLGFVGNLKVILMKPEGTRFQTGIEARRRRKKSLTGHPFCKKSLTGHPFCTGRHPFCTRIPHRSSVLPRFRHLFCKRIFRGHPFWGRGLFCMCSLLKTNGERYLLVL